MPTSAAQVRALMLDLTPLVEPLSIDEAFLDLSGTERLHGMSAAKVAGALRRAASRREIGITVSIGLSANKFLAKIASDLDKPRGFAVLGAPKPPAFLRRQAGVASSTASARSRRQRLAQATASALSPTCRRPTSAT